MDRRKLNSSVITDELLLDWTGALHTHVLTHPPAPLPTPGPCGCLVKSGPSLTICFKYIK